VARDGRVWGIRDRGGISAHWRRAPFVLRHHVSILVAVLAAALLVGLTASSAPFLSTAAGSAALKNRLNDLDPLTTGIEIQRDGGATRGQSASAVQRRLDAGVAAVAARVGSLGAPVKTLELPDGGATDSKGNGFAEIHIMARSGVLDHVKVLARVPGPGLVIADTTAKALHVHPGDSIRLQTTSIDGEPSRFVPVRVAGIYRALAYEPEEPYWANFVAKIYPANPDAPVPTPFAFVSRGGLLDLGAKLGTGGYQATDELPVDPRHLTLPGARALDRRVAALSTELTAGKTALARQTGCPCVVVSSLTAAITLADDNISAISPVVTLLSDIGIAIALAVAATAGAFGVRRRQTEAALMAARGEHVAAFSARTGLEALLPVIVGAIVGLALAVGATGLFAPAGTVDAATFRSGISRTALVALIALVLLAAAAGASFLRLLDTSGDSRRLLRYFPWELIAIGVGVYLLVDIRGGGGLARSGASGTEHPTLVVFVFPLLLVAGVMGLVTRLWRFGLRRGFRRARGFPTPLFTAVRRLAAARGLLVGLTVVLAVSFAAFFYAETVNESLKQSTLEKAYIGFGSDVQGQVGESAVVPRNFPFPTTFANYANGAAVYGPGEGTSADVLTVDPKTLAGAIHWRSAWGRPPAVEMRELAAAPALPLPVIVSDTVPDSLHAITIQGTRFPIRIIDRLHAFPGMTTNPLFITSTASLATASRKLHNVNPLLGVSRNYIWAKGPPSTLVKALEAPGLDIAYVTSIDAFRKDPQILLATRTYSYVRTVALAAALIALAGLVLYLQARSQTQRIASALARRMGLSAGSEILSLFLELAAILLASAVVGIGVAAAVAAPIVKHVDLLPDFVPSSVAVIPWDVAAFLCLALLVVAAIAATVTSVLSRRTDVSEDLRVA
jgi:putative ABC transport system permease protein